MDNPFSLAGKTALVTGAYRGLGYAIARGLARAGASVVINGRNQDALDGARATLRAEGLDATTRVFDVTDRMAIETAVRSIDPWTHTALPSSSGWATMTGGVTHVSPCALSGKVRNSGDAKANGCTAEQTS